MKVFRRTKFEDTIRTSQYVLLNKLHALRNDYSDIDISLEESFDSLVVILPDSIVFLLSERAMELIRFYLTALT